MEGTKRRKTGPSSDRVMVSELNMKAKQNDRTNRTVKLVSFDLHLTK